MIRRFRSGRWRLAVGTLALALLASLLISTGQQTASAAPIRNCDFDNDFIPDLIIGAPNDTYTNSGNVLTSAGRIDMLMGSADRNLFPDPSLIFPQVGVNQGYKLGQTMLCADTNADGFVDIVMGVPFYDFVDGQGNILIENAGGVQVFFGSPIGFSNADSVFITQNSPGITGDARDGDVFGSEIAVGFFNNDVYPDLVVSAPGEDKGGTRNAGHVHVIFGGPNGPIAQDFVVHQNSPGIQDRNERDDFFGESLAVGDFDGDGFDDLAVGVPREDIKGRPDAGAINIIYGNGNGLSRRDQFLHQDKSSVPGAAEAYDFFGAPLLVADIVPPFTGTRRWDLIVGVPAEDIGPVANAGAVYVLAGTLSGLKGQSDRGGEVWHRDTSGIRDTATAGDEFGTSLAAGFFDGDNNVDLAIGVPGDDKNSGGINHNSGSVHIIYGASSGEGLSKRDKKIHQDTRGVPNKRDRSDRFGNSLAIADLDGDFLDDLIVGVPQEDVRGNADAGIFIVLWGRGRGMNGNDARRFDQDFFNNFTPAPGLTIPGTAPGDNFGVFNNQLGCCGGLSAVFGPGDGAPPAPPRSVDYLSIAAAAG